MEIKRPTTIPTATAIPNIAQDAVSNVDITADGSTDLYAGGIAGYNSYSEPYNELFPMFNISSFDHSS